MTRRNVLALLLCTAIQPRIQAAVVPGAEVPRADAQLQRSLEDVVLRMGLEKAWRDGRLGLSLVDVTDPARPRYAGVNDTVMLYAASLPKIAIVLAGFQRISDGLLAYTPAVRDMFTRLVRFSSNTDASKAIHTIGFDYIARTLTSARYRLYDPVMNGGLWIGKAYGGPNDYWKRDPLHNLSHGATSLQVARFFLLMDRGQLVSPAYSAEMKAILGDPGIHHKFVKGLERLPGGRQIYRKSGTWRDAHCDAALVEADGKRYIAVALLKDANGAEVLPKLIVQLDNIIPKRHVTAQSAPPGE